MVSFLQNLIGGLAGVKLSDQMIALTMAQSRKMFGVGLTIAVMECATSQVKQVLQDFANQYVEEHRQVVELAHRHGWFQPYAAPLEQLRAAVAMAENQPLSGESK